MRVLLSCNEYQTETNCQPTDAMNTGARRKSLLSDLPTKSLPLAGRSALSYAGIWCLVMGAKPSTHLHFFDNPQAALSRSELPRRLVGAEVATLLLIL